MNISLSTEPISCDEVLDKCSIAVESQKRSLELKDLSIGNLREKIELVERRNVELDKEKDQFKNIAIIAFLMAIGAAFL